ncbi:hypothetical protein GGI07_002647 [Coemansia sp. Benny D115]|nr:hypothetical protein GGI07_002647 [Coemansia sp. Benny D115]
MFKPQTKYPSRGFLPKADTQAADFVKKYPTYDGRSTVVAIIDSGVDPMAKGLQVTSDGKRKVIDYIDCTGTGDVQLNPPQKCDETKPLELQGLSGRTLRLNPKWSNPTGEWRLGSKLLYSIFTEDVRESAKKERAELFERNAQLHRDSVIAKQQAAKNSKDVEKTAELDAQVEALGTLTSSYTDQGPILDCVVFHDGEQWRAAIDTSESGDLTQAKAVGSYKNTSDIFLLCRRQLVYCTLNFYDNGGVLSIVTCASHHGSHVAAIVAANYPEEPQLNGVAPGAQILSLKIGDFRTQDNESVLGQTRAISAIIENNVDMANLSYGGIPTTPNIGQWVQAVRNEVIERRRCIFVASAGNWGPVLSSVIAPGGVTDAMIGVGAYVGHEPIKSAYALTKTVEDIAFTWSSRGPSPNGARGVDIYAPGSAISSQPSFILKGKSQANGTSISSPNVCGCLALLVSAWKQEYKLSASDRRISPYRVKNAILSTAKSINDELGAGFIQVDNAWSFLKKYADRFYEDVEYRISILDSGGMQGIYLRNAEDSAVPRHLKVNVAPILPTSSKTKLENDTDGSHGEERSQKLFDFEQRVVLTSSASWVSVPETIYINSTGANFNTKVDATQLEAGRLHVATIEGYDSANVDRGPIFAVPITVIKPQIVGRSACIHFDGLRFDPTDIVRRFICVPTGSTQAEVTIIAHNSSKQVSAPALFSLQLLQMCPQTRSLRYHMQKNITIGHNTYATDGNTAEQKFSFKHEIIGNATLEVCLAHFWSQLDSHEVDVLVEFSGIVPASAPLGDGGSGTIVLNGNSGVERVDFAALVRPEYKITPTATLDTLRSALRPVEATVLPLGSERDVHPSTGAAAYQLTLDYKLSIKNDNTSVTPQIPFMRFSNYDNWVDCFFLVIYDVNKRRVGTAINYAPKISIARKGDYLVRLEIRHRSAKDLEALKSIPLMIDTKLSTPVTVPVSRSLGSTFTSTIQGFQQKDTITHGGRLPLFFKTELPKLPEDAVAGNILCGSLALSDSTAKIGLEYIVPVKAPTKPNESFTQSAADASKDEKKKTEESPADKEKREMEEALRKVRIDWVKKAKDNAVRDQLVTSLVSESKTDADKAAVLAAHLESLVAPCKNAMPWSEQVKFTRADATRVIEIADRIYALTYQAALTACLYESQKEKPASAEDKELKKKADEAKTQFVAALTAKCQAFSLLAIEEPAPSTRPEADIDADPNTSLNHNSDTGSDASVVLVNVDDSIKDSTAKDSHSAVVKDYEKAVKELEQWTSNNKKEDIGYLLATVPLHISKNQYAQALIPVLKWLGSAPYLSSNSSERRAAADLRNQLLDRLQWKQWSDYFRSIAPIESPATYERSHVVVLLARYCPFSTKGDNIYCGEHRVLATNAQSAASDNTNTRVPCPYDPSHSVDLNKLKKHMSSLCNARPPTVRPAFVKPDCNTTLLPPDYTDSASFEEHGRLWSEEGLARADTRLMVKPGEQVYLGATFSKTFGDLGSVSEDRSAEQLLDEATSKRLLRPVVVDYLRSVGALPENWQQLTLKDLLELVRPSEEFEVDICSHEAINKRKHGKANPKHGLQQASLLGHLEKRGLLDPKYAFVEFGAGKGELSLIVHIGLTTKVRESGTTVSKSDIFLVDRKNFRQKFNIDDHADNESAGGRHQEFQRIYIDIRDLDLASVEGLQVTDPDTGITTLRPIVAYSKHLCGAATDLTIKCLERYQQAGGHVAGIAIALCCHQVCKYSMFVDHRYLSRATTSEAPGKWCSRQREEFRYLVTMSSWAINSPRPATEPAESTEQPQGDVEEVAEGHYSGLSYEQRVCAGHAVKRFLDIGRVHYVQKALGMDCAELVYYTLRSTSPENLALLASRE